MVIKHPAKFGGRGHCGSGDTAHLICHVTLQDHPIKESCNFMKKSSLLYATTLSGLAAIAIVVSEIFLFIT